MTQAATLSQIPRDEPLAIVSAQSDAASFDGPIVRARATKVWLTIRIAAAFSGSYKFYGSINGTDFVQYTLTGVLLHGTATAGTAEIASNAFTLAAGYGNFAMCLDGLMPYLKVTCTRTGGGAASNVHIEAISSEEGDAY